MIEYAVQREGEFGATGPVSRVYKQFGTVELSLHVYDPPCKKKGTKTSAILLFHGGAWNKGETSVMLPQAQYLSQCGITSILVEYRVRNRHKTTPFECVADAKSAIRWVRQHHRELAIHPQRIAAGGISAGGHMALIAAMVPGLENEGEDQAISSKPNALALFSPVIDTSDKGFGRGRVGDRWKELSPAHHVTEKLPPTILVMGTKDPLHTEEAVKQFAEQMRAKKNRCDLWLYPGCGHDFHCAPWCGLRGKGAVSYFIDTMERTCRFLRSIDFLAKAPIALTKWDYYLLEMAAGCDATLTIGRRHQRTGRKQSQQRKAERRKQRRRW